MSEIEQLSEPTREVIMRVARALKEDTGAVAVLLTGPHALGIDRPDGKMYFVSVTEDEDGVIEHRFLERYGGIDRQMEIGVFPRKFVERLLSEGYWDMVSYRAAEALRAAVPLVDPSRYGRRSIEGMAKHLPERRFVSDHIHRVVATFDDAMSLYSKGDHAGAVLVAREALRLAVELVLKTSEDAGGGPEETLKNALGGEAYRCLCQALGIEKMSTDDLRAHLDDMLALSRTILQDLGIADGFLNE